jgi:hypothetical protein
MRSVVDRNVVMRLVPVQRQLHPHHCNSVCVQQTPQFSVWPQRSIFSRFLVEKEFVA